MPGLRIKVNSPMLPFLTLQLIVMAVSVERSEMEGLTGNLRSNTYHDENLVKIGPVEPEIILLKGLFLKRRKLTQAEHYSPRGMHAARAK